MKKLRVTVDGKSYDVVVEILDGGAQVAPTAAPAPSVSSSSVSVASVSTPAASAPARSGAAAGGPGAVTSPLAGKVVTIDVKVGQTVAAGAQVATIEAMKMNTYVFAPAAGQVAAVLVNPGDGVDEGAVLLQIA